MFELKTLLNAQIAATKNIKLTEQQQLRIARKYASKIRGQRASERYHAIHEERTSTQRQYLRNLHLAKMFIKGREYREVEQNPCWLRPERNRPAPSVFAIVEAVSTFGYPEHRNADYYRLMDSVGDWLGLTA